MSIKLKAALHPGRIIELGSDKIDDVQLWRKIDGYSINYLSLNVDITTLNDAEQLIDLLERIKRGFPFIERRSRPKSNFQSNE